MELKNKFKKINKNLIAFISFGIFWTSLLVFTGTLTSGYHFVDDPQILAFNKSLHDNGLVNTITLIIKNDLNQRFRPLYFFHRIVLVKLLSTNYLLWSIYNGVLAILTSYFLFLFVYRQGYKFVHAFIFPFLTLVGAQSAIWWRLGPAETIGFFLLSAALFFLVNSIFRKKNYQIIISIVFLFFASLSKESFTLFIPAYIILLLWFKQQCETDKTIFKIIRSNFILITILLVVLLIEVYIIIFVVGTNKIGYAGIDNSFSVVTFLKFIYVYLRHNSYSYLIIFGLFILLQNVKSWKITSDLKKLMPYIYNIAILLAIIMPQFILYNKSGISERYLLPLNLGFSIFIIYLLKSSYTNNEITLFSKRAFIIFIILVTYSFFKNDTLSNAKSFAKEGELTNKFLTTIVDNTKINDTILVVLNINENFERGLSINSYMTIHADRKNINFYTITTPPNNDFKRIQQNKFSQDFNNVIVKEINSNFSCIAILPFVNNKEIKTKLDSNFVYQRIDFDYLTVYVKKTDNDLID